MVMVTERYCNHANIFELLWRTRGSALQFRLRRRQFPGDHGIGKGHPIVGAIAERLIGGVAAAAERNHRPASQAERGSGRVYNLEFSLDADGAVILRTDFGWHFRIVPQAPNRKPISREGAENAENKEFSSPWPLRLCEKVFVSSELLFLLGQRRGVVNGSARTPEASRSVPIPQRGHC